MKTARPQEHVYTHRFSNGLVATATLSSEKFDVEWKGKPDRSVFPEYLRWRNGIIEDFAKRTGKRILVITIG
jgi:hypothetical protein